jgi:hypothetical protein
VSAFFNRSANLLVSATFLTLILGIAPTGTFRLFASFAIVTIVFTYKLVPETKHGPLE